MKTRNVRAVQASKIKATNASRDQLNSDLQKHGNFEQDQRQHRIAPTIIFRLRQLQQNWAISVKLRNQCSGYLKS
jgi:hypothetical protein